MLDSGSCLLLRGGAGVGGGRGGGGRLRASISILPRNLQEPLALATRIFDSPHLQVYGEWPYTPPNSKICLMQIPCRFCLALTTVTHFRCWVFRSPLSHSPPSHHNDGRRWARCGELGYRTRSVTSTFWMRTNSASKPLLLSCTSERCITQADIRYCHMSASTLPDSIITAEWREFLLFSCRRSKRFAMSFIIDAVHRPCASLYTHAAQLPMATFLHAGPRVLTDS